MPNTGERGEITARVNAKETEVIRQSKKLVSKTKQPSAAMDGRNLQQAGKQHRGLKKNY
jgi:hypothetical protein